MKFGPLSKPFLQVPVMSLAQKVVVSEPGHEPDFDGRPEQGADLYNAMLEDTGQPALVRHSAMGYCRVFYVTLKQTWVVCLVL